MSILLILTINAVSMQTKAIFSSAVLPGAGELMLGKDKGKAFLIAEAGIWFVWGSMTVFAHKYRTASHSYAASNAHANINNTDEDYYDLVERYQSADLYNEYVLRDAMDLYPGDYEKQQEFLKENGVFGADQWRWDSTDDRLHYWYLRRTMRDAFKKVSYCTGLFLANRILSMIDVALFTRIEIDPNNGEGIGINFKF